MKHNNTEILSSNNILNYNFSDNKLNKRNGDKKKLIEYKIEQEMKSLPEELALNLKRGLSKHELTSEVYIPKSTSYNKKYDKNLLISKIKNYEKFISDKKEISKKLANNNSSFSKVYKYIKDVEGKKNRQQQYFDDIERIYLVKNYNMRNCGIKPGDNIFSYSLLIDNLFGNDLKNDQVRLINEIKNKDIRREHKLIFKFNDEVIDQKLQRKVNNRNKILMKRLIIKNDYGIEDINQIKNNKYMKKLYKQNYRKIKFSSLSKSKKNLDIVKKEETYLDKLFKEKVKNLQNNLENIQKEYNAYEDNRKTKLVEDEKQNNELIKGNSSNEKNYLKNYLKNNLSKTKKRNEIFVRHSIHNCYPSTNLNLTTNENNKVSIEEEKEERSKIEDSKKEEDTKREIFNELPRINRSFEEIKKLNISSSTTTNCSIKEKNEKKLNLNLSSSREKKNSEIKVINNMTDYPKIIFDSKKNLGKIKIKNMKKMINNDINAKNLIPYLKLFFKGDKKVIGIELKKNMSKFQEKNKNIFKNFRNKKLKVSDLHGFVSNFQKITNRGNFGTLYEKNKYLKKYNYNNLMSNFYDINDESDAMNIKRIDSNISNIYYDFADFILGHDIKNKKIFG